MIQISMFILHYKLKLNKPKKKIYKIANKSKNVL